jgi:hypothetical protein
VNGVDELGLAKYVGGTVSRVHRLKYEVDGEVVSDPNEGTVEVVFDGGAVLLCESAPDGETVRIGEVLWADPFAGPLSPENEEYVRTSGKWTRHDVSDADPFTALIGRKVVDIAPIAGSTGKLYGLVLNVSGYLLACYANADELRVRLLT